MKLNNVLGIGCIVACCAFVVGVIRQGGGGVMCTSCVVLSLSINVLLVLSRSRTGLVRNLFVFFVSVEVVSMEKRRIYSFSQTSSFQCNVLSCVLSTHTGASSTVRPSPPPAANSERGWW